MTNDLLWNLNWQITAAKNGISHSKGWVLFYQKEIKRFQRGEVVVIDCEKHIKRDPVADYMIRCCLGDIQCEQKKLVKLQASIVSLNLLLGRVEEGEILPRCSVCDWVKSTVGICDSCEQRQFDYETGYY